MPSSRARGLRRLGAAAVLLLTITPAVAGENLELRAAQQELKLARKYLQAAGHNYEGHRRRALDHVNLALREIRDAIENEKAAAGGVERGGGD